MPVLRRVCTWVALAVAAPLSAAAAPLDPAACDQLRQEIVAPDKAPVRANFLKGPAWAKANLKPDQLAAIEKLIETEQQFLFRCPQPKRQLDAATEQLMEHGTGSDPDPDAPKPAEATPKAPAPAKGKSAAAPAEPAAGTDPAQPKARPKKAAAKAKAADAYAPETKPAE